MLALQIENKNNTNMKFYRHNGKFFINVYNPSFNKHTCIELTEEQLNLLTKTMQFFCTELKKGKE